MAGAVNSTETDGESPSGDAPPSVDLASVRSSLSSADSDNPPRSLRAIASSFDEAHASTSAARFRAECALCALLDDPRRPLDAPARLAALFVLARGGEALGADDGSRRGPGEAEENADLTDSLSPFAETLRAWASSRGHNTRTGGDTQLNLASSQKHDESVVSTAERAFLIALSDPAERTRVADLTPETWLREEEIQKNLRIEKDAHSERALPDVSLALSSRVEGDEKDSIVAPFVARAFDAERFWFAKARFDDADGERDEKKNRPLWDKTAGVPRLDASFSMRIETHLILEESAKHPVAPMRQAAASLALRRNPSLAFVVAGHADAFRETVEKNPPIAAAVLLATARVPSARVARLHTLLDVILDNVGVHAMEVVAKAFEESRESPETKLGSFLKAPLPSSFLTPFTARCVRRCLDGGEGPPGSRRQLHASSLRLTCMFLQVLLRERHVQVADLPAEVESFCVEFMSVKEAADLFRLVKQLQREDALLANGEEIEAGGV